jgi:predicted ATPase/DNA-binding SARP family transcriptional activator
VPVFGRKDTQSSNRAVAETRRAPPSQDSADNSKKRGEAANAVRHGHNRVVQVAILGPLEIHDDGGAAVTVAGARLRGLIARLALAGGQPVSTGALCEAVWDCAPPADAANALQTLVSRARKALGRAAAVEQSAAGYRLAVAPDDVDALRFERLVAEGAVAEALALWRGPALADAGDFAEPFARRLEELRLDATVTFLTRELDAGRAAARVGELEALAAEHPLHEKLAGLLMRALAATGRQADALAAYEALRTRLTDELGIDPGAQVRAVHLEVLRGEIAVAPASASRARTNLRAQLTSFVGRTDEVARVRKALKSYRLVTLVGPGGAGKTRLATEVAAEVRYDAVGGARDRAVPDGMGPDDMGPDDMWPDGIWIIELASVTDAADVPQAVLGSIGLRESRLLPDGQQRVTSRDARTRLLEGLGDARALLVLDNCEHLIDACAHLADALLAHSPRLRIVATSREPLGITGESLFVVPPLAEDPAVRLFADRAEAVSPDFSLDGESRLLIIDIVRRLDGLPLAIELAAARLRTLPLAEISRRLTDRFRLLTGGSRTALPRHRTLRAVVEWSWELLTPAERMLAERFSVFPAGATPAAVATVCAGTLRAGTARAGSGGSSGELAAGEADELLSSLVDKSLLQPLGDGTRLRMLETIREYGAEKLAGRGEVGELRRRHAAHYTALMREAAPILLTRDQLSWVTPLRADRDNILAALHYWCDAGDAENALSLAISLSIMALLLGTDTDMAEWIGEALAVPGEVDAGLRTIAEALHVVTSAIDPAARGAAGAVPNEAVPDRPVSNGAVSNGAVSNGAVSNGAVSDWAGADGAGVAYPGLFERLDALDIERYPVAGVLRPVYAMFLKDDGRVRAYLDQARAGPDEWLGATAWLMTAGMAENYGNFDEMRIAAAEAVDRFRALGERWGLSMALRIIGNVQVVDGDLDSAVAAFTEASHLLAELAHREDLSAVQLRLAEIAARRGDLAKARELSAAARSAAESEGSPMDRGITAAWWAAFEARWGDIDVARPYQAVAERHLAQFAPAHPAREHLEAMVAATGARIAIADKDLRAAREQSARSYRAAIGAEDMSLLAQASGTTAELAQALGQPERAAELLGAGAVVRGADDPTDPTALQLVPLLRACLGDDRYARAYQAGKALSRPEAIERLDPAGLA